MHQAISDATPIIDVDGSYLYRKHHRLSKEGIGVAPLDVPSPPLTGRETVTESSVGSLAPKVPRVTSGVYSAYYELTPNFTSISSLLYPQGRLAARRVKVHLGH